MCSANLNYIVELEYNIQYKLYAGFTDILAIWLTNGVTEMTRTLFDKLMTMLQSPYLRCRLAGISVATFIFLCCTFFLCFPLKADADLASATRFFEKKILQQH
jgi:hypothetical protein